MSSNPTSTKAVSSEAVSVNVEQFIGIITINYPPVNALGQVVRQGIMTAIEKLEADVQCKIIIIQCVGRTFIAGADIKEFGAPPLPPFLPDVVNRIESCTKPVVASLFGTTLGGGFEVALACHYRVALSNSKVGLPEVNLGLIPGAGGTQRLTQIVGVYKSLEMITSGKHYPVDDLLDTRLFDAIFSNQAENHLDTLQQMTRTFCHQLIENNQLDTEHRSSQAQHDEQSENIDWTKLKADITKKARGREAPLAAFEVIKATSNMPVIEGMAIERETFIQLLNSEQSAALRHAFSAEKKAGKIDNDGVVKQIDQVGIIGGGTMGIGICTAFLSAGYTVTLIEQNDDAADNALNAVTANFTNNVKKARITEQTAKNCLKRLTTSSDKQQLNNAELIIEAIFEDIEVKKQLFCELDDICSTETIFATNTSYLDIDAIAAATKIPSRVIGMHFFSPANIMKLLEVVEADKSSADAIATAMNVGKKLGKISVLVKVCFGFAGNRMYTRYGREIQQMLLEGATVEQIDKAMTDWGMAMGPLAVQDLSGIDIGYKARKARPEPEDDPGYFKASAAMVENGRLGRKTMAGFYHYDEQGKKHTDAHVTELLKKLSLEFGFPQRTFTNAEIVQRALLALISEGLALHKEGIVQHLSDIDVIWLHGYGFPRYKGGPMFQAKTMGIDNVKSQLHILRKQYGHKLWPEITNDF